MVGMAIDPDGSAVSEGVPDNGQRRPRLFIREMVMENFKSYAGEQRVGPFHKCFSAVVGPNGSGKSNVIDAMLFVFGKRAKQMRLNKVSELIHNSTDHQNLDKARVSVYFQEIVDMDDESYKPVIGSDFVITRVAFRDNSSKYYIDERTSTFTEVTKKLRNKGVDLDNNRFLILQGEVEQISLMRPKSQGPHDEGFLEYLEDIIGSNQYVEKIDEAYKQLELLNEKRSGVVQRVKLADKEKASLEGAKNEAESYMLKEAEIFQWRGKAAELALEDANAKSLDLKKILSEQEANLKQESEKLSTYLNEMKDLESDYTKHNQQQEEVETSLKSCQEEFREFERQDTKYREDLKHLKLKLKKLEDKSAKDMERVQDIEKETLESTSLIPKLEEDIVKLSQQLSEEEEKLEKIKESSKSEVEKFRKELLAVQSDLEPWDRKIITCQGRIDIANSESSLLKEKHQAGKAAYEGALGQIESWNQKIREKQEDQEKIGSALKENQLIVKNARNDEQACLKEQEVLLVKEQAARQKVNELRALLEAEKSHGSVLKAILQAKESGQIQGIYGRLGDLGAIEAKYDIAISTACGGLDYIIVETASAAQACVELLRTKGLGVATFLILDKQGGHLQKMSQKVHPPEDVPRLFDLVTVRDERLRLAFYSVLGNTVVAKDLEQATRIAYGRNQEFRRVVTLDGAVFEKSGTMSGGGAKPQGGRMGTAIRDSTVSREALQNAEDELASLTQQLAILKTRITAAIQQYQKAEKTINQLELDSAKNHMEIEGLQAQLMDVTQQLNTLKAEAIPAKQEVKQMQALDASVCQEQKELATLQRDSEELRVKANELQKKIENSGGEKLKHQKSVVEKLQTEIDNKSSEVNRRNVQITSGSKALQKLQKAVQDAVKDKSALLEDKENKVKEFKEIEKSAFVVQEKYQKLQEVKEEQLKKLESTKKAYNQLKNHINKLRTGEVDAQYKLDDTKKLFKDWETKSKMYQKKIQENDKDLQLHIQQTQKEGLEAEKVKAVLDIEGMLGVSLQNALETLASLEAQLKECRPQLDSIAEYRRKAALYDERVNELNDVTKERDEIKRDYEVLRKRRLDEFMTGFNSISLKLKEMYQMITLGGDAELELVDSLDPFAEGVVFSVRPPKKSWKNIGNLSGGEKTLSSLALVFALHHYKPTPLYVMDEIDAALDFKNVSIVGHYIKDRTKDAQFIIISLRNNMFELADRLVGIYKTNNCTKSITINPKSFALNTDQSNKSEVEVA